MSMRREAIDAWQSACKLYSQTNIRITRWHLTNEQRAQLRELSGQDITLLGSPVIRQG